MMNILLDIVKYEKDMQQEYSHIKNKANKIRENYVKMDRIKTSRQRHRT